ncbi:BC1872 family protein [Brevibacillus reuszeri]|uniref:BC1872 family protein n=1 Tax=Brevibacillus reuszeri TaxID=54915 RepID=UPI000CCBFEC6|nr:hypothetical protein [Brevibacillus reuszeri]
MNRDQIIAKWETLTPRERDAWVAEVVFGYETYGAFYEPNGVRILIPRYTEDIAAAWAALSHNGIYGEVSYMGDQCRAEVWARWIAETGVGENEYAVSSSETEAICLAAIFANLLSPAV